MMNTDDVRNNDMVKVIHCEDCFYSREEGPEGVWCSCFVAMMPAKGYCSFAEKKKRKVGYWTSKGCSICGFVNPSDLTYYYCPNCGALMRNDRTKKVHR